MDNEQNPEPVWAIRASVIQERSYGPGGLETRRGTKHFAPGAKVYCAYILWDGPLTSVGVIGHHRGSHQYVTMILPHNYLTNFRADLVYSPHVINLLPKSRPDVHDGSVSGPEAKAGVEKDIAHLVSLSDTMT
jgi:hypothetical protein